MEPLISNLEIVSASKQGVQLLEENNIATLYKTQPHEIDPVVTAALALMNKQSPLDYILEKMGAVETLRIGQREMQWDLELRPDNGYTITKSPEEIYGQTSAMTLGFGGQEFAIGISDREAFIPNDIVVPEDERIQLIVTRVAQDGLHTIVYFRIFNNTAVSSMSSSKVANGMKLTRWATVASEYSDRGGSGQISRPIKLRNSLMTLRDSYAVTRSAKQTKNVIEITNPSNPSEKTWYWADRYYWNFLEQVKRGTDIMLLEGVYNQGSNVESIIKDEAGRPIFMGAGLQDQISPSNLFYYNGTLDFDYLEEIVSALANQTTVFGTDAHLVLFAGKGLRRAITNAVTKKYAANVIPNIYQTGLTFLKDKGDDFEAFQRNCSRITFAFGNTLDILPMDIFSDVSYYKQKVSTGFPDTRKSMEGFFMNIGSPGKQNIKKVYRDGAETIMAVVEGLIGADGKQAKNPSSGKDGYVGHVLREVGICLLDPMGSGRMIYNGQ